ncbi:MAG: amino acid carrier protein [Vicinamibacterales bacterium]
MRQALANAIQSAADALFMPWLVLLLFGSGLFLTFRYRGVQVRRFPEALREALARPEGKAGGVLTPFQAFMTALAATIGTGNIAGVATAIVSGGPGALFWIWCYGFCAMAIKFTEAVLGVSFRLAEADKVQAGPMYYLRDGLKSPFLASAYAVIAGVAALVTTPMQQPNSMALVIESQLHVPTWISGIVIAVMAWLVIIGGIKSIGRAAEKLAPLKVAVYVLGGLVVIVTYASRIPDVFALVFREAFSFRAAAGGSIGMLVAMRYGLARGLYANEAGYGTAAMVYGTAKSTRPVQQGLNAVTEVFIVSFVTSTLSALTILLTGAYQSGLTSTAAVGQAFDSAMPGFGGLMVVFSAFMFGYTTLIGWSYYGEHAFEYLFGTRFTMPYRWIYCLLVPIGATAKVDLVWAWGDLLNAMQIFPNIIGVLVLSGLVAQVARDRGAA